MNRRFAHVLTRMYPRPWRERYGAEFEDLLVEGRGDLGTWVDVILAAVGEHFHPSVQTVESGGAMSDVQIGRAHV